LTGERTEQGGTVDRATGPRASLAPLLGLAMLALMAGQAPALAQDGQSSPEVRFWPRRLCPDETPLLHVQLSMPDHAPQATLSCQGQDYALGGPVWSHPEGILHAFDLEWVLPRRPNRCELLVSSGESDGRFFVASHSLLVRPGTDGGIVDRLSPQAVSEEGEAVLEVGGRALGSEVKVVWVSASAYVVAERWVERAREEEGRSLVFVPFAPALYDLPAGDYLLVVENRNRSAAVHRGNFVIAPGSDIEIADIWVEAEGERRVLAVTGNGLGRIGSVLLEHGSFPQPLASEVVEGAALDRLRIFLPPSFPADPGLVPELDSHSSVLMLRPAPDGRLSLRQPARPED